MENLNLWGNLLSALVLGGGLVGLLAYGFWRAQHDKSDK